MHLLISFVNRYSFLCFVVFYLSLSFLTLMHFYHAFLACSIYSFRYVYHIFISYNIIFISCHLLVTSYILLTYIFMYSIRLSYLITYTYTFLYLYVYILSIPFMCSSSMPYHFILLFYTPLHIKSPFIDISCSYLSLFLSCIPIDFTHAISTLGTTIIISDVDTECH